MVSKQEIEYLIRKRDSFLTDEDIYVKSEAFLKAFSDEKYDFSNFSSNVFTQQKKKRKIYSYEKLSCEDILCHYLKKRLDTVFGVRYASRSQIMSMLFNILPVIKDLNDFVIIRVDFKSFFDSVLVRHVYEKYIEKSVLKRFDKELLEKFANEFKYCYAGLCLSNGMTEIVCRDFDESIKAKLSHFGVFFYERYVDDILLIMNKHIAKDKFLEIMDETILEVFGKSPVKLSKKSEKFAYITRRETNSNSISSFSFLGYEFVLNGKKDKPYQFQYGITEKKRKKYKGIIERAFIQYLKDDNLELLRQRIKIYSARVVIGRISGSAIFDWLTKGVVVNYNELRHHRSDITQETKIFLKDVYFDLMKQHKIKIPYFMKQSGKQHSIYNIWSNLLRNRSIVFQDSIGVSRETLIKWIKKIDSSYRDSRKDYFHVVLDYLDLIKIE